MKRVVQISLTIAAIFAANAAVAEHYHVDFYNYLPYPVHYHAQTTGKDHNHDIAAATTQTIPVNSQVVTAAQPCYRVQ